MSDGQKTAQAYDINFGGKVIAKAVDEEWARRLAALVSQVPGIPTELLEQDMVLKMFQLWGKAIDIWNQAGAAVEQKGDQADIALWFSAELSKKVIPQVSQMFDAIMEHRVKEAEAKLPKHPQIIVEGGS